MLRLISLVGITQNQLLIGDNVFTETDRIP